MVLLKNELTLTDNIYMKHRITREGEIKIFHHWFTPQMVTGAWKTTLDSQGSGRAFDCFPTQCAGWGVEQSRLESELTEMPALQMVASLAAAQNWTPVKNI